MASEFITRVERDKDEPYTVIFRTDDADKYKHIEDECRKMIGHAKPTEQPTVDAVPVVHGEWIDATTVLPQAVGWLTCSKCHNCYIQPEWLTDIRCAKKWNYCPNCGSRMDGERKDDEEC